MPQFKLPHNLDPFESSYMEPEAKATAIAKLVENFEDITRHFNTVLADLDAEVFYHVIPIKTGEEPEASVAFTQTHRVIVVIDDIEYYLPLDTV